MQYFWESFLNGLDTQPVGVLNEDGVEVISLVLSQAAWVV